MESATVAFVFPGQGSQSVGMGRDLWTYSTSARQIFKEVDNILEMPLTKLMFEGPEEELRSSINSQPAIMAVSLASLKVAQEQIPDFPQPSFLAGHSLGEYTALVVSEVLTLTDAIQLAYERGRLMTEASNLQPGGMAAIWGMEENELSQICSETNVQIANINSPNQIVISGGTASLSEAIKVASTRGAKRATRLDVSGAFHSNLMEYAQEGLKKTINNLEFHDPSTTIIANCTASPLTTATQVKQELLSQLCNCVQWTKSILAMVNSGVSTFMEFGSGKVLTSLIRRISKNINTHSFDSYSAIHDHVNAK